MPRILTAGAAGLLLALYGVIDLVGLFREPVSVHRIAGDLYRIAALAYVPLWIPRATRPWAWLALLLLDAWIVPELLLLHLFGFDPAWVPPRLPRGRELLFFDGGCGLCHRTVRFALAEERHPGSLALAPIGGETFRSELPDAGALPDSVVVRTSEGAVLVRSRAVLHLLERLGGLWRLLAGLLWWIPRPARDAAYDLVARIRHRLFARPPDPCPAPAPHLRDRFLP